MCCTALHRHEHGMCSPPCAIPHRGSCGPILIPIHRLTASRASGRRGRAMPSATASMRRSPGQPCAPAPLWSRYITLPGQSRPSQAFYMTCYDPTTPSACSRFMEGGRAVRCRRSSSARAVTAQSTACNLSGPIGCATPWYARLFLRLAPGRACPSHNTTHPPAARPIPHTAQARCIQSHANAHAHAQGTARRTRTTVVAALHGGKACGPAEETTVSRGPRA
jgi:hypothetical protein